MDLKAIRSQVDRCYRERRTDQAEQILNAAYHQAREEGDEQARIAVCNEMEGLYRLMGQKQRCLAAAQEALDCLRACGMEDTVPYATTLLNYATACVQFGQAEEGLEHYAAVERIFRTAIPANDYRFASLYNNVGQAYMSLGRPSEAARGLEQSLEILKTMQGREMEIAISHTNAAFASLAAAELERAERHIRQAEAAFDAIGYRGVNYDALLAAKGQLLCRQGDDRAAAACYAALLESTERTYGRNQTWRNTVRNLAVIWRRAGDEEKAAYYAALLDDAD